jgi:transcriptional regulator with XRE-family HTH domain
MSADPDDTGDLQADVGRRLLRTRTAMGLTQNEMAARCGVGRTTYNQYETGVRRLTLDAAMNICREFSITLDWLYMGDPSGLPVRVFEKLRADRSST